MTKVVNSVNSSRTLEINNDYDLDEINLKVVWGSIISGITVSKKELLDALGAVVMNCEYEKAFVETEKQLMEALNKLDTIKRLVFTTRSGRPHADTKLLNEIYRILTPPKPFVLPTELPATIKARHKDGSTSYVLDLLTDGRTKFWVTVGTHHKYTPEQLQHNYTDFELVEEPDETEI